MWIALCDCVRIANDRPAAYGSPMRDRGRSRLGTTAAALLIVLAGAFPTSVLAQAPQFPFLREICQAWDVPKAPAAQRAVTRGGIPTLIIAGSYDAITSPQAAQAATKPLSRATLVTIPGVGHFVVPKSDCAQRVMASFLADPAAPDTGCVAALKRPPFTVAPR